MKDLTCFSTNGEEIPLPRHVILFHELTHAYHNLSGKRVDSNLSDPIVWESDEEYKTIVGFPSNKCKNKAKITENAFRKAEGLPERFGSWTPSGDNEMQALSASRVKILGNIHQQNQLMSPLNLSPPPIAMCSINDLGLKNRCILLAKIQGVNRDFTPNSNETAFSSFFLIDPSNILDSMIEDKCYGNPSVDMTSESIKQFAISLFPLNGIDFKVKSLKLLRFSQQEIDILLHSIPQVKL